MITITIKLRVEGESVTYRFRSFNMAQMLFAKCRATGKVPGLESLIDEMTYEDGERQVLWVAKSDKDLESHSHWGMVG
jgi:hypothetical protein